MSWIVNSEQKNLKLCLYPFAMPNCQTTLALIFAGIIELLYSMNSWNDQSYCYDNSGKSIVICIKGFSQGQVRQFQFFNAKFELVVVQQ